MPWPVRPPVALIPVEMWVTRSEGIETHCAWHTKLHELFVEMWVTRSEGIENWNVGLCRMSAGSESKCGLPDQRALKLGGGYVVCCCSAATSKCGLPDQRALKQNGGCNGDD